MLESDPVGATWGPGVRRAPATTVWGWNGMVVLLLYLTYQNFNNFNPLMGGLDGYYALAAYIGKLNLRKEAFAYTKRVLRKLLLGTDTDEPLPSPRDRRIYFSYGLSASLYTIAFMAVVWISWFLPWMIDQLGTVGLVLAAWWFVNAVGRKAGGALVRLVIYVARNRRRVFTPRRSLVFAATLAGAVALLAAPCSSFVDGQLVLEPKQQAIARVTESGVLDAVMIEEGARVAAGQPLAILRSPALERERVVAAEELEMARMRLAMLEQGASTQELDVAAARSRARRVALGIESQRYAEARRQRAYGVATNAEVVAAQGAAVRAAGNQAITDADTNLAKAGSREQDIAAGRVDVEHSQTALAEIDRRIAALRITSPIAGVVVGKRVRDRVGERFATGVELFKVYDDSEWHARVVPDRGEALSDLSTGQVVAIRPNGSPDDEVVETRVDRILVPEKSTDLPVIQTSQFRQPGWRGGMTGHARIYGPRHSLGYRLVVVPVLRIVEFDLWRMIWG